MEINFKIGKNHENAKRKKRLSALDNRFLTNEIKIML